MSERIDGKVSLKVDGQDIPMNDFVKDVFVKMIQGFLSALDNIPADRSKVQLSIELEQYKTK